ncbi:MAG TPA: xanthine dehydrogenase family protein molybdopterin-binding subunit, partial [bacterium]|nr:xanthine dehydrogenase family protein molybdopterin-binding subunit [bacterium]
MEDNRNHSDRKLRVQPEHRSGNGFSGFTVGRPVLRPDTIDKVRGRAKYVGDLRRPGMLHAVTVRSRAACMKNLTIDSSAAEQMPGVVRVVTAADIPGSRQVPLVYTDQPFLAGNAVRFHGEAVALVVAESREQARAAADAVVISGEIQDPVLTVEDALADDAPVIHAPEPGRSDMAKNIFKSYRIHRGDAVASLAGSDYVIDRIYRTPHQEHAYLETQGMLAEPDDNGCIRVYGSMQCPFYVQDAVAAILGCPRARITVIQTATGGGFGGKEDVPSIVAGHAALLAHLTGRPVSLIYDREEDFRAMSKRHPSVVRVRIGADGSGRVTGAEVYVTLDGGAYATLSPIVLWRSAVHAAGPYNWKAVSIHAQAVATHTVPNGAFRGFGEPQVVFAIESAMDELAALTGKSPPAFRLDNMIQSDSDVTATGQPVTRPSLREALEKAMAAVDWTDYDTAPPRTLPPMDAEPVRGVGCSVSFYGVGLGAGGRKLARAGAYVQVEIDGSIRVFIGNTEMGQGARSVIAQIAAETLSAPFEAVHVSRADTSRVPDSGPTVASRTTVMSGNAVMNACRTIRDSLVRAATDYFQCDPGAVEATGNGFSGPPGRSLTFLETVGQAAERRLPLASSGWFVSPYTSFNEATDGQGHAYMTYVWSANAVAVEVDPGTLQVRILKLAAAHDVGRAINPREVRGQIRGGALQGIGYALSEQIAYSGVTPVINAMPDGVMLNPGFSGYICPTAMDTPEIIPIILENAYDEGPYGARGIGEPPLIGVAPAVANAVARALGVRVRQLPLCPEHILEAVRQMSREPSRNPARDSE